MIPKRFYRLVFAGIMSLFMIFIMSGIITFLNLGFIPSFFAQWLLEAFPKAWVAAFPIVFFGAPRAAKLAESLMKK